jgi:hypothetical protein
MMMKINENAPLVFGCTCSLRCRNPLAPTHYSPVVFALSGLDGLRVWLFAYARRVLGGPRIVFAAVAPGLSGPSLLGIDLNRSRKIHAVDGWI